MSNIEYRTIGGDIVLHKDRFEVEELQVDDELEFCIGGLRSTLSVNTVHQNPEAGQKHFEAELINERNEGAVVIALRLNVMLPRIREGRPLLNRHWMRKTDINWRHVQEVIPDFERFYRGHIQKNTLLRRRKADD